MNEEADGLLNDSHPDPAKIAALIPLLQGHFLFRFALYLKQDMDVLIPLVQGRFLFCRQSTCGSFLLSLNPFDSGTFFIHPYKIDTSIGRGLNPFGSGTFLFATLALNVTKRGVELIDVTSVYGREAFKIENDLKRKVFSWDKEKGSQFLNAFRLQSPSQLRSDANLSRANIKTDEELTQGADSQQEFAATTQQYGGEAAYEQSGADGT